MLFSIDRQEARQLAQEVIQQLANDRRVAALDDDGPPEAAEVRVTVGELTETLVEVLANWS